MKSLLKHTAKLDEAKLRIGHYLRKLTAINRVLDKQAVAQKSYAAKVVINETQTLHFFALLLGLFFIFLGFSAAKLAIWACVWAFSK